MKKKSKKLNQESILILMLVAVVVIFCSMMFLCQKIRLQETERSLRKEINQIKMQMQAGQMEESLEKKAETMETGNVELK